MRGTRRRSTVSFSLLELQRLRAAFEEMRRGTRPAAGRARTLRRLVAKLGPTAVPTCVRELGGGEVEGSWAYTLLLEIARAGSGRDRAARELRRLATDGAAGDTAKLRALALLAELGEPLPESAMLVDPAAARRQSLSELASHLGTTDEVARAADVLLEQLSAGELLGFVEDLTRTEPAAAVTLVEEMLLRDDVDEDTRGELRRLRAPLCCGPGHAPRRTRRAVGVLLGRHPGGRRMLLASARRPGRKPARWRALCALISPDGLLIDAYYRDDLTHGGVDHELVDPLREVGFTFAPLDPGAARGVLASAARNARAVGLCPPRDFYLGRDLFGIRDEHLAAARRMSRETDLGALHGRAMELCAAGEPDRARPLLERYVAEAPDDPEGLASLGLCLLELGDTGAARRSLQRAHWLDPQSPVHLWNLAAAAHRAGKLGACYLALAAYLDVTDKGTGAEDRRRVACDFVSEYERLVRLEHPGADPRAIAHAEAARL